MNNHYNLSKISNFKNIILNKELKGPEENLNYNVSKYTYKNNNYNIVRYDKSMLSFDMISSIGLLRSVIINNKNKVICFSPPKSISSDLFIKNNNDINNNIIAEEFIEGTMINVFWDESLGLSGAWEISTRNTVGGNVYFFNDPDLTKNTKTFNEMFLEAAKNNNFNFNMLNPLYCYSFVLQHPENRIVIPYKKAQLYLVEVYKINNNNGDVTIYPIDFTTGCDFTSTDIKFPEKYYFTQYDELKNKFASMNTTYNIMGVVIKNTVTNERCKLRNPTYEYVRHLRGNQPKLQYQYLSLRKEGCVGDFLKYYPEHKSNFSLFRNKLHEFTFTLYKNYISCYIKKEKPLKEFPDNFRTHMFYIHKKYIDELKPNNNYVSNTVVIAYINNLHPTLLMHSLNDCLKKRRVDFIISKFNI